MNDYLYLFNSFWMFLLQCGFGLCMFVFSKQISFNTQLPQVTTVSCKMCIEGKDLNCIKIQP